MRVAEVDGEPVEVAASVGVHYVQGGDTSSADTELAYADARLYQAKGRRCCPG